LTNITIPESVDDNGANAFYGCSSLERTELPPGGVRYHGNTRIDKTGEFLYTGDYSYHVPLDIKHLVINSSVETVKAGSFKCSLDLVSVELKQSRPDLSNSA
jgi:hypothetical protein